jgi:hypothetical protein
MHLQDFLEAFRNKFRAPLYRVSRDGGGGNSTHEIDFQENGIRHVDGVYTGLMLMINTRDELYEAWWTGPGNRWEDTRPSIILDSLVKARPTMKPLPPPVP